MSQKSDPKVLVHFDDKENCWSIPEESLTLYFKDHLSELREHALEAKDLSNRKMAVVISLCVSAVLGVFALAFNGATFWAFVLMVVLLADVKPILAWLGKE